jgi:drug/metabolite transporter (DMT)-like permease
MRGVQLYSRKAIAAALMAALLFGASTPLAKLLAADVPPVLLAALLYLGSGVGLWTIRLLRLGGLDAPHWAARDWLWFAGAIASGGVIAPILLMYGLQRTPASNAALLLNLEAVLTALVAWIVFRENAGWRPVAGMMLIVAGGAVLARPQDAAGGTGFSGAVLIAAACLGWAIDNNLTRKISAADADFIAGTKGLAAGSTSMTLALALGATVPRAALVASAMTVGLFGYGLSLVLFVQGLRGLGSARAGAYFATAPFLGAAIAVIALHESAPGGFWLSASLMAVGVALHLTEHHGHRHTHEVLEHAHPHSHDDHHRHAHDSPWDGVEPHTHVHRHEVLVHDHPHYPDLHHRHDHQDAR